MKQNFTKLIISLIAVSGLFLMGPGANAQCANNNILYADITPGGVGALNSSSVGCNYGGEYCTAFVEQGAAYSFNTCGATFDTQITLYADATGTYLGYDDDGSPCGNGNSDLYWVATFTGTVRILVDQHNCTSNSICSPLECIQETEALALCSDATISLSQGLCDIDGPSINVFFDYLGACQVFDLYFSENGGPYLTIDASVFGLFSGSTLNVTAASPFSTYTMYYVLEDGTTSDISTITTTSCGSFGCTGVDFVINPDCYGSEVGWSISDDFGVIYSVDAGTYPNIAGGDVAYTTNLCLDPGCYTFTITDTYGDGLDAVNTLCATLGSYYAVDADGNLLFDGNPTYTTSQSYTFCVGSGCTFIDQFASYSGCFNNLNEYEFNVFYDGACGLSGMWLYNDIEGWQYLDLSALGFLSGESVFITNLFNNTFYEYQFELSDGTLTPIDSFFTGSCNASCGNASLGVFPGACINVGGTNYYTTTLTYDFTGACNVSTLWWSIDGVNYDAFDVSAEGLVNGSSVEYYFAPSTTYYLYYELSDGTTSFAEVLATENCESGEFICDCAGTQIPIEALAWLGDGNFDNGTFFWNGIYPVNFNCQTWGFDCGDDGSTVTLDPYATCYGNLPPANGCSAESCFGFGIDVYIDCYFGETAATLTNEFGEIVYSFDETFFTAEYQSVSQLMCLPAGCYTFTITDTFGDGLAGATCATPGYFELYDENGTVYLGNGAFGSMDSYTFCIGQSTCSNLSLNLNDQPCYDYEGQGLTPSFQVEYLYNGACEVQSVFLAEDGAAAFTEFDQTADGLVSGTATNFYNLVPNMTYYVYYTLTDGSLSQLYTYVTGDCNNEVTICDCAGLQHTSGVLAWLGDGYADNGFYTWDGQNVDFNCATWGFDCGDVAGSPSLDPYNVCGGGLPPFNGCSITEEVLGCMDPLALNYNPDATVSDGSCIYNSQIGCTNVDACNYLSTALFDDGSCEFTSCAGCTDPDATNYDASATIDDGSCDYTPILGCTDPDALNYNSLATQDDGSCVLSCQWPSIVYTPHCVVGTNDTYMITMSINQLGNGAPYVVGNSFNQEQYLVNFNGTIEVGPFPNGEQVVITVVSSLLDGCFITSPVLSSDCTNGVVTGCTDELAGNYNPLANQDNGSCTYDFTICDCAGTEFSPATRFQLGNGSVNNGSAGLPNFNCATWGYDCGDIVGAPNSDPFGVCSGNLPPLNGCDINVVELESTEISVYPNPTTGMVNIASFGKSGMVQIRIFDQTGKLIESTQKVLGNGTVQTLDLTKYASGTYQIEFINSDKVEHKAIVLQR